MRDSKANLPPRLREHHTRDMVSRMLKEEWLVRVNDHRTFKFFRVDRYTLDVADQHVLIPDLVNIPFVDAAISRESIHDIFLFLSGCGYLANLEY
jgi:hypothetical protein